MSGDAAVIRWKETLAQLPQDSPSKESPGVKQLVVYKWDGVHWSPAATHSPDREVSSKVTLRVATLNVLADCFPFFMEMAIKSPVRFAALPGKVVDQDADVIGLNEVTAASLAALLAHPYIRAHYSVTELPDNPNGTIRSDSRYFMHGCVVLSKLPVMSAEAVDCSIVSRRDRPAIVVRVAVPGVPGGLCVCSLHTMAYQDEANKICRARHIALLAHHLSCAPSCSSADGFIILGDLNLHYDSEDAIAPALGLLDCWAETHPELAGKAIGEIEGRGATFDAELNPMIRRYIPGEWRRMRLDRILCGSRKPGNFPLRPAEPCLVWGTEKCDEGYGLCLSDHYGLLQDFSIHPREDASGVASWVGDPKVRAALEATTARVASEKPHAYPILYMLRTAVSHIGWLFGRGLRVW